MRRRPVQQLLLAASRLHQPELPLQAVRAGGWVPGRLHDHRRVVLLRHVHRQRVQTAMLGVLLPDRLLPLLHDHQHPLHSEKAFGRPALRVPAPRVAGSRRGMSEAIVNAASRALARKSSRRQFFKFLGAGSLGAGLFLTGTDVTLGSITPNCAGCGGGPCNPSCFSPDPVCSTLPCKPCQQGGGCPVGCTTSGEWFCCRTNGCRQRCSECTCPSECCHCFTMMSVPCVPRKWSGDQPCPCAPLKPPVRVAA